ncbi:hypothetical protein AZE42_01212 [Rhizopogon vesiculosus]|uniref:F-box domain-containing protein n=1 Tax=Rhizopogon vesiculosus TaxID=180088 RepID=A0A1J8Q9A5_9AGAM|nr:hypothetical protein AZE42_01212 [Rhizopogon vesiculosus]
MLAALHPQSPNQQHGSLAMSMTSTRTRKTWSSDLHGELRRRYLSPSPTRTPYYTANPSPEPQSDPETDDDPIEQPISMTGPSRLTLDLPVFSLNSPQFQSALQLSDEDNDSLDDRPHPPSNPHTNLRLNINFNIDLDLSQATLGHSRPPSPAPTADFSMISPPNSPSYTQYHSQFLSPPHARNTLPFFRTTPSRPSSTHTHLRSHSIGFGNGKRRVRPNITKLWESISSPSPRSLGGSKSSPSLKHPFPAHKSFPRSSPNLLRAKRKIKRPSVTDVFNSGGSWARGSGDCRYTQDVDYGTLDPLDGEEGELVDHDGYFDVIEGEVAASPSSYTHSGSPLQSYSPSPISPSHYTTNFTSSPACLPRPDTPSQAYTLCRTSLSPYASASTSTFTSTYDCHTTRTSLPLPPELTLHILSLLPVRSVVACMLVSRAFCALARDNGVWWGVWQGMDGRPRVRARVSRPFGRDAYSYPYANNFAYGLAPSTSMSSYSAFLSQHHGDSIPSLSSSSEDDSDSDSSSLRYTHQDIRDEGVHGFPLLEDGEDDEGDGPKPSL